MYSVGVDDENHLRGIAKTNGLVRDDLSGLTSTSDVRRARSIAV
jgi:hypothetical protein